MVEAVERAVIELVDFASFLSDTIDTSESSKRSLFYALLARLC